MGRMSDKYIDEMEQAAEAEDMRDKAALYDSVVAERDELTKLHSEAMATILEQRRIIDELRDEVAGLRLEVSEERFK